MEVWQAMITVDVLRIAMRDEGQSYLAENDMADARVVFEDDEDLPFEEWWQLVFRNGAPPLHVRDLEAGCYNNVILPLPGSSSPMYTALFDTEFHRRCRESALVDAMRRRMLNYYKLDDRISPRQAPESPTITIIDRKKTRMIWDFESMVAMIRSRFPHANITVVDFAQLTLRDQVRLATETDILVGIHGAGLTHSIWLKPTSVVVEIKPPLFPGGLGYFAQLSGASYFEGRTLWAETWNYTVNNVPLPIGWKEPEMDTAWQASDYVYVAPDELLELIAAAVRRLKHKTWSPPLKAECVTNRCHYTPIDAT